MKDEILEELWRVRDEFARKHNYDLDSMVAELQERERNSPHRIIGPGDKENQGKDRM